MVLFLFYHWLKSFNVTLVPLCNDFGNVTKIRSLYGGFVMLSVGLLHHVEVSQCPE